MSRSKYDPRAVRQGAVLEAVVVPVLFLATGSSLLVVVAGAAVGGAVAGLHSRTPGDEHVDGGFAGAAGLLLGTALGSVVATATGLSGAAPPGILGVLMILVIGVQVGLFVGAAAGYLVARARHRPLTTTG